MSKTFNLNDASYDAGSNAAIFNNAVAGVVENCKARLERTKQEDKENHYELIAISIFVS